MRLTLSPLHTTLSDTPTARLPGCDAEAAFQWPSLLFFLQLGRRLAECFAVHSASDARMSIVHYIVGLSFYPMASLALLRGSSDAAVRLLSPQLPAAVLLFLVASAAQLHCHLVLASLRRKRACGKDGDRSPPRM